MGLLALAGIQSIVWPEPSTEALTARVSADTPEKARGRVLAALGGEEFTIEAVRPEDADWLKL
jgi:hypothetical protein